MRRLLLVAALIVCGLVEARPPLGIAYYDVDHLHDTIPSLFYNDDDYTPAGRYQWNTERYLRKIRNTAAVIDSLSLPIVALWSVENEAVVRDIAAACKGDYTYLHRTLNSFDGMDFALLYYGDLFFPGYVESGRRYLYIEGMLRHERLGLVLCSDTRMAAWVVHDLREERPGVKLVVLGRSGSMDAASLGMCDAHARAARLGRGNVRNRRGWQMRDRIVVDTTLKVVAGEVFIKPFLVDQYSTYPVKTIENGRYRGGYGYALPIYVYIE